MKTLKTYLFTQTNKPNSKACGRVKVVFRPEVSDLWAAWAACGPGTLVMELHKIINS